MSSRRDALVAHLSHLGLARNEALAYLTLLEDEEAAGRRGDSQHVGDHPAVVLGSQRW